MASFTKTKLIVVDGLCEMSGLKDGPQTASAAIKRFRKNGANSDPSDLGTVGGCTISQFFAETDRGYSGDIPERLLQLLNANSGANCPNTFKIADDIDHITGVIIANIEMGAEE